MTFPAREPAESARALDDLDGPTASTLPPRSPAHHDHVTGAAPSVSEVCPYLTAASGSWRSASPHRAHRCAAVDPPGVVPAEKQRRHCLSVDHASCQVFRAARASRAAILAPGLDPSAVAAADAARRPLARTAPLILEQPRLRAPIARWPLDRALSQAVLIGLMVVAFIAVALARFGSPAGAPPSPSPAASIAASPSPTARPTPRPTPSPSASTSASTSPGANPSASASAAVASPSASFRTTYRVQAGDTLVGIAAEFNTTVAAIRELNGMTSSDLRIGQLLKIP